MLVECPKCGAVATGFPGSRGTSHWSFPDLITKCRDFLERASGGKPVDVMFECPHMQKAIFDRED